MRANPRALAAHIMGVTFQASDRHVVQARVLDEVALALRYQGIRRRRRGSAPAGAGMDGMTDLAQAHPLDLHAGARRMVALAAAVAHGPEVLMLDESQRGLDAEHLARLERLIAFMAARGAAVLIVTHDLTSPPASPATG